VTREFVATVKAPCALVSTKVSCTGPVERKGRSGGDVSASVLWYEPASLMAPVASHLPTSTGAKAHGWRWITTSVGGAALAVDPKKPANKAAIAAAAANGCLFIVPLLG
jgi:hypothetical protein